MAKSKTDPGSRSDIQIPEAKMGYIQSLPELHRFFEGADVVDIKVMEGKRPLGEFIAGMLSYYPWWIVWLYRIREVIVALLGLVKHEKPEALPSLAPQDISLTPGDTVTFFTVRKAAADTYWVAETPEDKHLSAYFGVVNEKLDREHSRFHVFTTVRYLHWTGPVYFNLIRPFHHLVVSRMMKSAISG
jgi:hypothetical protein